MATALGSWSTSFILKGSVVRRKGLLPYHLHQTFYCILSSLLPDDVANVFFSAVGFDSVLLFNCDISCETMCYSCFFKKTKNFLRPLLVLLCILNSELRTFLNDEDDHQ